MNIRKTLIRFVTLFVGVLIVSYVFSGIGADGVWPVVIAAVFMGLVNVSFKRVVRFVTGPLNVLTLGLFMFVVNGLILWVAGVVVGGFYVSGATSALAGALVISMIGFFTREFTG